MKFILQIIFTKIKPKDQCVSTIGRYTGLEPITTICRWYPFKDDIEGFHILFLIPTSNHNNEHLNPAPFESDSIVSLKITMREIHKRFDRTNDTDIINEWKLFSDKWLPLSECSVQYLNDLKQRRILYKDASLWYILYVFCYFFLTYTNALFIFVT